MWLSLHSFATDITTKQWYSLSFSYRVSFSSLGVQCCFSRISIILHPHVYITPVADLGGFRGFDRTPLRATPSTKKYWTRTPPLSDYRTKKLLLWLTLACFSKKFIQKSIAWTGWAGSCSQTIKKWAWFYPKVGVVSKISHALRTQEYNRIPL